MTADNTGSKEDSMPIKDAPQPQAMRTQIIESEKMDKLLKYAVRRGLYAASYLSMVYKALSVLHDYSSRNIDEADFTSTFRPFSVPLLLASEITVTIKGGKVRTSMQFMPFSSFLLPPPLKRWISKFSTVASEDAEISSKEQLLTLIFALSLFRNFFIVIGSLPTSILTGLTRSLSATLRAARSVPALIAILIVMFATGDAWRLFGLESAWRCSILLAIIVAAGIFFMTTGFRGWIAKDGWRTVVGYSPDEGANILASWAKGTPAKDFATTDIKPALPDDQSPADLVKEYGLMGRYVSELGLGKNMNKLLSITVAADVVAVFFWVSLTFVIVGIVAVSEATTKALTGGPVDVIWHLNLLGISFVMTRQLLFVSMVLGAIAALTFSAASVQDASSRRTFSEYALGNVRRVLAAYAYYYGGLAELLKVMTTDGTLSQIKNIDSTVLERIFEREPSSQPNNPE